MSSTCCTVEIQSFTGQMRLPWRLPAKAHAEAKSWTTPELQSESKSKNKLLMGKKHCLEQCLGENPDIPNKESVPEPTFEG